MKNDPHMGSLLALFIIILLDAAFLGFILGITKPW